jgi:hypothetical protein
LSHGYSCVSGIKGWLGRITRKHIKLGEIFFKWETVPEWSVKGKHNGKSGQTPLNVGEIGKNLNTRVAQGAKNAKERG